jgi:hypothetical protein
MTYISKLNTNIKDWYEQQNEVTNQFKTTTNNNTMSETTTTTAQGSTGTPSATEIKIMGMSPVNFAITATLFAAAAYGIYRFVKSRK